MTSASTLPDACMPRKRPPRRGLPVARAGGGTAAAGPASRALLKVSHRTSWHCGSRRGASMQSALLSADARASDSAGAASAVCVALLHSDPAVAREVSAALVAGRSACAAAVVAAAPQSALSGRLVHLHGNERA